MTSTTLAGRFFALLRSAVELGLFSPNDLSGEEARLRRGVGLPRLRRLRVLGSGCAELRWRATCAGGPAKEVETAARQLHADILKARLRHWDILGITDWQRERHHRERHHRERRYARA